MRRIAISTITAVAAAGALAAPAPASGPLEVDEVVTSLACTTGHDGLRCAGTSDRARDALVGVRVCRRGARNYRSCIRRGHRQPLRPPELDRLYPGLDPP